MSDKEELAAVFNETETEQPEDMMRVSSDRRKCALWHTDQGMEQHQIALLSSFW